MQQVKSVISYQTSTRCYNLVTTVILTTFEVSIFSQLDKLPFKNTPYRSTQWKTGKLNWFEDVSFADMKHPPNCITHSTFDPYDSSNIGGYQFVKKEMYSL